MGLQIIKQPNNFYSIFDTVSDTFTSVNNTRAAVLSLFMMRDGFRSVGEVEELFSVIDAGGNAYHQFTISWEEACSMHSNNSDTPVEELLRNNPADYSTVNDKEGLLESVIVRISSQFIHAGYLDLNQVSTVISRVKRRIEDKIHG